MNKYFFYIAKTLRIIFLSQSSRILLAAVCGFRPIKLMSTFVKTPPPSQLYLASTNYHEWDKQKFKFVDFSLKGYIVPTRKARTEIPDFVIFSWVGIHQKIPRQAPLSQSSHSGQPSLAPAPASRSTSLRNIFSLWLVRSASSILWLVSWWRRLGAAFLTQGI